MTDTSVSTTSHIGVTGANGYIGEALTKALEQSGRASVVRLVRQPVRSDDVAFDLGTVPKPEIIASVETVVHLAWDTRSRSETAVSRCVDGSISLATRVLGAGKRFVFVSTMSAEGGEPSRYSISKQVVERHVLENGGTVVRPGLVVGSPPFGLWRLLSTAGRFPVVPVPADARIFIVRLEVLLDDLVHLALDSRPPQNTTAASVLLADLVRSAPKSRARTLNVPAPIVRIFMKSLAVGGPARSLADSLQGILGTPIHSHPQTSIYPVVSELK